MSLNLEVPEKNMKRGARDAKGQLACHATTEHTPSTRRHLAIGCAMQVPQRHPATLRERCAHVGANDSRARPPAHPRDAARRPAKNTPLIVRTTYEQQQPSPLRASIAILQQGSFASEKRKKHEQKHVQNHVQTPRADTKSRHQEKASRAVKILLAATIHFLEFAVSLPCSAQSSRIPSGPAGERSMAIESPSMRQWYERPGTLMRASIMPRAQPGLDLP